MIIKFDELKQDKEKLKEIQTLLQQAGFYNGEIDGIWGTLTDRGLDLVSRELYLNTYNIKTIGPTFLSRIKEYIEENNDLIHPVKKLDRVVKTHDIAELATYLNVSPYHIGAIIDVEAAGSGFLKNGLVKILFEAHWFSKLTSRIFDNTHPDISTIEWNRSLYKGGEAEHSRLKQAMRLDKLAALESTSWGMFQIMGFNYKNCGYDSIISFVKDQHTARGQLDAVAKFLKKTNLDKPLRKNDWTAFAKGYNGPKYYINKYDEKLELAFERNVKLG